MGLVLEGMHSECNEKDYSGAFNVSLGPDFYPQSYLSGCDGSSLFRFESN
jgi:hypothetical protein